MKESIVFTIAALSILIFILSFVLTLMKDRIYFLEQRLGNYWKLECEVRRLTKRSNKEDKLKENEAYHKNRMKSCDSCDR